MLKTTLLQPSTKTKKQTKPMVHHNFIGKDWMWSLCFYPWTYVPTRVQKYAKQTLIELSGLVTHSRNLSYLRCWNGKIMRAHEFKTSLTNIVIAYLKTNKKANKKWIEPTDKYMILTLYLLIIYYQDM